MTFSLILKAVFPPMCISCGVITNDDKKPLCPDCDSQINYLNSEFFNAAIKSSCFDRAVSVASFDTVWKDVIHGFKYNRRTYLAGPLSQMLSKKVGYEYDLIVPVPLHVSRLKERGYNQSALLAKRLAKECGVKCVFNLLLRVAVNRPQVEFDAKERFANVKGVFAVGGGADFRGKDILLIDDVMTTGATANECARVLKKAGANKVDVLTLARA